MCCRLCRHAHNRIDSGSPKRPLRRRDPRRVSSQAWKHAMRQAFVEESLLDEEDVGKLHQKVTELVEKEIAAPCPGHGCRQVGKGSSKKHRAQS